MNGKSVVIKSPKRHLQTSRHRYGKSLQNYYYVKSISSKLPSKACTAAVSYAPQIITKSSHELFSEKRTGRQTTPPLL
jgi:hypothetical protein